MQGHQRYSRSRAPGASCARPSWPSRTATPPTPRHRPRQRGSSLDARLQDAEFSFHRDREAAGSRPPTPGSSDRLPRPPGLDGRQARPPRGRGRAIWPERSARPTSATAEAVEAARLAKADQGAILVAEFSELEGYVAAVYARWRASTRPSPWPWSSSTCPRGRLAAAGDRGRGAAGGGGEGRQPDRRLRGRRGADRMGTLRPRASARRGAGADRARPRLGRRPLRPVAPGVRAPGGRAPS